MPTEGLDSAQMKRLLRYWPIMAVLMGLYLGNSGWLAILLYHGGMVVGLLVFRQEQIPKLTTRGFHPVVALLGFLCALTTAPAIYFLLPVLLQQPSTVVATQLADGLFASGLAGSSFWAFAIYFCTLHPLLEEYAWRGILYVDSNRLHLRDVEFAAYHILVIHYFFPASLLLFGAVFLSLSAISFMWRTLRKQYAGLSLPILSHIGGDLGTMAGVWCLSQATQ